MNPIKAKTIIMLLNKKYHPLFQFGKDIKPLPIGVEKLIDPQEFKLSKTELRRALSFYTGNFYYQQAITRSPCRYNLDGTRGDKIEQTHKDYAAQRIQAMKARRHSAQESS